MSSVSVVVPTLGGARVARVIDSLAAQTVEVQVIVVDDGGGDPALDGFAARMPAGEVLRLERNSGFSRACNLAARRAEGDALVLLNDDCVVDPDFCERIAAPLDAAAGVGMVASVMREWSDPHLIDSAGMELDQTLLVWDYLNGEPLTVLDRGVADPVGPSAAAAAFDRDAFLAANGFDEALFAYWEDADLVLRLRREGIRCRLAADARGTHEHSASFRSGSARKNYLTGYGRGYVLRKWGVMSPRRTAQVLARDAVVCLGQAVIDRNVSGVRGRIQGWRAAAAVEPYRYPENAPTADAPRARDTLRRRLARRRRLRARAGMVEGKGEPTTARVLRSVSFFHLAETSGPSRSLERELEWLAGEGELEVVVPGPGAVAELFGEFGSVRELDYEALTRPGGGMRGTAAALLTVVADVRQFRRVIRERDAGLVVVVTAMLPAALIAARRERIPAVVYCGEIFEQRGMSGSQLRARRALAALTGRLAAGIVAGSATVARQFAGMRCTNVEVVYPPIPPDFAAGDGAAFRAGHGIAPDAPLVVAAGSLTEGRGQDLLLRAVAELRERRPELRGVIAGAPFERPRDREFAGRLEALRAELGLSEAVSLPGHVDDVPGLLAAGDVFVNPARFDEPFGRAAFEAALAGTPAVITRVGAADELFAGGRSALVVAPDDPAEIARAIERLLDDPELRRRLVAEARAFAESKLAPEASVAGFRRVVERAQERAAGA